MFLQDNTTNTTPSGLFGDASREGKTFGEDLGKAILEAAKPKNYISSFKKIEDSAKNTARNIFGTVGSSSKVIQETLIESLKKTISIGASLDDTVKLYDAISSKLERNNYLTEQNLTNLIEIQKSTGLAADEVATLVVGFQDLGQGTEMAVESIGKLTNEARKYGLNVGTFLKEVGKNIKLVNAFGFKDGVEGLGRMVARAQALRMDITQVKSLAADLLNPEKAITLAAEMQTLGGAIGDLGDPFKLMFMAENDMEGLQTAIINTAKSAVMFNEETGQFKLTGVEMRRLRAQAEALGLNYEEMANMATKAAKEQYVLSQTDFGDLNDEQRQLIANLAEVGKGGEINLKMPGFEGSIKDFTSQSETEREKLLQALKKQDEISNMSEKEIAISQLSIQEQQLASLNQIRLSGVLNSEILTGEFGKSYEALLRSVAKSSGDAFGKAIGDTVKESGMSEMMMKLSSGEFDISADLKNFGQSLNKNIDSSTVDFKTNTTKLFKDFGGDVDKFGTAIANFSKIPDSIKQTISTGITALIAEYIRSTLAPQQSMTPIPTTIPQTPNPIIQPSVNDGIIGPSEGKVLSYGKGTIKFDPMDTIIAGTDLFGGNKQDNTPKNIELRINGGIRVDGLRGDTLGELLMNDPAFIAKIKDVITSTPNQFNQKYG